MVVVMMLCYVRGGAGIKNLKGGGNWQIALTRGRDGVKVDFFED